MENQDFQTISARTRHMALDAQHCGICASACYRVAIDRIVLPLPYIFLEMDRL